MLTSQSISKISTTMITWVRLPAPGSNYPNILSRSSADEKGKSDRILHLLWWKWGIKKACCVGSNINSSHRWSLNMSLINLDNKYTKSPIWSEMVVINYISDINEDGENICRATQNGKLKYPTCFMWKQTPHNSRSTDYCDTRMSQDQLKVQRIVSRTKSILKRTVCRFKRNKHKQLYIW